MAKYIVNAGGLWIKDLKKGKDLDLTTDIRTAKKIDRYGLDSIRISELAKLFVSKGAGKVRVRQVE